MPPETTNHITTQRGQIYLTDPTPKGTDLFSWLNNPNQPDLFNWPNKSVPFVINKSVPFGGNKYDPFGILSITRTTP
jgi:hypothetical protein